MLLLLQLAQPWLQPNAQRQVRRWQPPETGTGDGTEPPPKIAPSPRAAPAASTARNVGLPVKDDRIISYYSLVVLLLNDD